jgi:hypothetical protein
MAAVGDASMFVEEPAFADMFVMGLEKTSRVMLQSIGTPRVAEAFESASWLRADHPGGCAGVVLDGWSIIEPMRTAENASLRALALLEAASLAQAYARVMGLPVIMGVRTAEEEDIRAESAWAERELVEKVPLLG